MLVYNCLIEYITHPCKLFSFDLHLTEAQSQRYRSDKEQMRFEY